MTLKTPPSSPSQGLLIFTQHSAILRTLRLLPSFSSVFQLPLRHRWGTTILTHSDETKSRWNFSGLSNQPRSEFRISEQPSNAEACLILILQGCENPGQEREAFKQGGHEDCWLQSQYFPLPDRWDRLRIQVALIRREAWGGKGPVLSNPAQLTEPIKVRETYSWQMCPGSRMMVEYRLSKT